MSELDLLTLIKDTGVVGALFVFIVGGVKRWWVWGWQYREYREYADAEIVYWRNAAFRALNVSEIVTGRKNDDN